MSLEWITPKTDWAISTPFTYVDYNRIRNNLLYLNDKFNEMYPDKAQTLDLGEAKTGYTNEYYPSEFNAFEEALISFKRIGQNANIGSRNYYKSNGDFISYNDLNRIESCCLRWNDLGFVDITTFRIEPTSASFDVGDTKTFNVIIEPSNATRKNDWFCHENSVFECTRISDTSFTAKNILGVGEIKSINYIQKSSLINLDNEQYDSYFAYRRNEEDIVLYNVGNTNEQGYDIFSDDTALTLKSSGSLFEHSEFPYVYHEFMLIGNGIDGSNISTLLTNVELKRQNDIVWGTDYTTNTYHDDRVAPWRAVFQNVINNEFSNQLKNALKSVSKTIHFSATSVGNYSSKYHLIAMSELGFSDSHVVSLGNVTYPYLINNGFISTLLREQAPKKSMHNSLCTRSLWDDTEEQYYYENTTPDKRYGMGIWETDHAGVPSLTNGKTIFIHAEDGNPDITQPLIFLDKTLHVKPFCKTEGNIYTIDWTNQSDLTLNDLPLGSIIIDANGTNATLASSVELWDYNNFKIGSFSGTAGTLSNGINVKVQPSNCSTMDNIVIRTYDENVASVDNIRIQGNEVFFTIHSNNAGSTYLEASLDGKSHIVEVITRPQRN